MIERVFILKRTDVFGSLPDDILRSLAFYLQHLHLPEGANVYRKGDIGKSLFIIAGGSIRIHDDEITLATLTQPDVFGTTSVLTSETRITSATVVEEAELLRLDQDVLYELMAGNAALSKGIIKVLVERYQ